MGFIEILIIIIVVMFGLSKMKNTEPIKDNSITLPEGISQIDIKQLPSKEDQAVILKEDFFNINNIPNYEGKGLEKFEFIPQNFKEFIGQKHAKNRAETIIKEARRKDMKCHFTVDGIQGHGKTTFIQLLARKLNAKLIERVGRQIDMKDLENIVKEINESKEEFVMFFIDEIDTMDWKLIKTLNPIINRFKIAGIQIKPFIFACATINKHLLIQKNSDTLGRIPFHIKFERYNTEEIATIVRQYKKQLFPSEKISEEVIKIISENCKFNPRISTLTLLQEFIVEQNISKVLENNMIVKDGLTIKDIEILKVLQGQKRPIGAKNLAQKVKLSEQEYVIEFEPFLVEYGYVDRIPSRTLGAKGREFLEELDRGVV